MIRLTRNIQWLVEVARDVDHIILNCDDMYKDRWIVGYLLQLKHCYFKHMGSTEAFGYNVVNNNKIWNLDYPKEHIENLEAQRKMDIKADLWFRKLWYGTTPTKNRLTTQSCVIM